MTIAQDTQELLLVFDAASRMDSSLTKEGQKNCHRRERDYGQEPSRQAIVRQLNRKILRPFAVMH